MPNIRCICATTGIEPPSRLKYGCLPQTDSIAAAIARTPALFRSEIEGVPPCISVTSQRISLGAFASRYAWNCFATSAGSWSGTRRMEIFAIAQAGMTVFDPAPVKPDNMPLTSSVGRAPARSAGV